ncbi:MAG: hypothetical protein K6F32_03295 [Bacilli bacterium]|nr:hypothetical protein [Bacilli bacterium]
MKIRPATLISVETGNLLYFVPMVLLLGTLILLLRICRKKGRDWTEKFIEIMYWVNFAGHFLKQFVPSYIAAWPLGLARSTPENFCAIYVMAAPFLFKFSKDYGRDYLCYVGIVSAVLVYIFPTGAWGRDLAEYGNLFEVGRFYFCHAPLLLGGVLMLARGVHKVDYRRVPWVALMLMGALGVTYLNNVLTNAVLYHYDWTMLLDRSAPEFNSSFQQGPGTWLDPYIGGIYDYLIPFVQTFRIDGTLYFTPVLYLVPFAYPLALLIGYAFCIPLDHERMAQDHNAGRARRRLAKIEKDIMAKEANVEI